MKIKDFLKKILEWKDNLKIYSHYYVEKCPYCGSEMTGRYVNEHRETEITWIIVNALKHGEIVKGPDDCEETCFCLSCGESFNGEIRFEMIDKKELQKEKNIHHVNELLQPFKEEAKQEKERNGFISLRGFIGKF